MSLVSRRRERRRHGPNGEETDRNAGRKAVKATVKGDGWEQDDKPILPTTKSGLGKFFSALGKMLSGSAEVAKDDGDGAYNPGMDSESVAEREMD